MNIKRIIIISLLLIVNVALMIIYKSYICAMLVGAFTTLLMFQTIGQVIYQKAIKRIDAINKRLDDATHYNNTN